MGVFSSSLRVIGMILSIACASRHLPGRCQKEGLVLEQVGAHCHSL